MKTSIGWVVLVGALAACGGKQGTSSTGSGTEGDDDSDGEVSGGDNGVVEDPETLDQITTELDRKRGAVARCMEKVLDTEGGDKRAEMVLQFVITPEGTAVDIQIAKTSITEDAVQSCVVDQVREIEFPHVKARLDWSYTYKFEVS